MSKMGRMNKILAMVMGMCASMPFEASAVKNRKKGSSKASASVSKSVSSKKVNSKKVNSKNLKKPLIPVFSSKGGKLGNRGRRSRIRGVKGVPSRFARVGGIFLDRNNRPTKVAYAAGTTTGVGAVLLTAFLARRCAKGYWLSKPKNSQQPVTTTNPPPQGDLQQDQNNQQPQVEQLGVPQPPEMNVTNPLPQEEHPEEQPQVEQPEELQQEEHPEEQPEELQQDQNNQQPPIFSGNPLGLGSNFDINNLRNGNSMQKFLFGNMKKGQGNLDNHQNAPVNNNTGLKINNMRGPIPGDPQSAQHPKKKAGNGFGKFLGNIKNIFNNNNDG